jgi:hypothetical protein
MAAATLALKSTTSCTTLSFVIPLAPVAFAPRNKSSKQHRPLSICSCGAKMYDIGA